MNGSLSGELDPDLLDLRERDVDPFISDQVVVAISHATCSDARFQSVHGNHDELEHFIHVIDAGGNVASSQNLADVGDEFRRDRCLVSQLVAVGKYVTKRHHSLLTSARAVTRYGTGAILAALGGLQRKAWVRRAASTGRITRASDTTTGGGL